MLVPFSLSFGSASQCHGVRRLFTSFMPQERLSFLEQFVERLHFFGELGDEPG